LNKRTNLRLFLVFVLIGFIVAPAFADEQTIELSPEVPYVDIQVEATAPTQITIETTNGTPQTNPNFIDSWVELWQGVNKLFANDDGAHSATNVLASIISAPIEAGTYFIRATSFAWIASNQTQTPTGSYLLTWNGVATIPSATPTPTVEPTPSPTTTIEPIEQPSPTPIATDSFTPTPTPELTPEPQPETNTDNQQSETILIPDTPTPAPEPTLPEIVEIEPEIIEQIVEEETIETPIVEPELSVEQINEQYVAENTIELSIPTIFEDVPGAAQVLAAAEAILNVGSDMTQEQREESQSVVVAAVLLTQISQMAGFVSSTNRRIQK
jgi:hypothetical protein